VQNLPTVALAVPEISLGAQNLKGSRDPYNAPFEGDFILHMLGLAYKI